MAIPILNKEDVETLDPIDEEKGLNKSITDDNLRIENEYELKERSKNNGGNKKDIRKKIIEFIKNDGYLYTEGSLEFDDETIDIFGKDGILIEVSITTGVDDEVIKQILNGIMT